ncbi:MAG: DUF86 domain-containing protein [Nitriliruptorales bacterium]|nr:DUF86 domain-containing protein [Nitriliruptorales bacterium]
MDERTAERLLYLDETCAEIALLAERGREAYDRDIAVARACQYSIVRLAADIERLGSGWIAAHPSVAWTLIRGMRNRIAHDYLTLDGGIVWEAVTQHVPTLREQLQADIETAKAMLSGPPDR